MRLLAPGEARQLRQGSEVLAWLAGPRVWWLHDELLQARPASTTARLELRGGAVDLVEPAARWRLGAQPALRAGYSKRGWKLPPRPALPYGARRSATLTPFAGGECWVDEGWLYRRRGRRVQALGRVPAGAQLTVGEAGAVLVGDERRYYQGCPPSRAVLEDLPRPLEVAWGVCFEDSTVFGLAGGEGGALELKGGRWTPGPRGARPVAPDVWLKRDRLGAVRGFTRGQLAWKGRWLAGPGARVWDLETGTALTPRPAVRSGPTGFAEGALFTADPGGETVRIELSDGRVTAARPTGAIHTEPIPRGRVGGAELGVLDFAGRSYVVSDEGLLAERPTPRDAERA